MGQDGEFIRELLRRRDIVDREFKAAREKRDQQRSAIDTLLAAEGYVMPSESKASISVDTNVLITWADGASGTTREYITLALRQADGPMKMSEIVQTVEKMGCKASHDTVRTVLQKMLRSAQVARLQRGMYSLLEQAQPVTVEPPPVLDNLVSSLGEVKTN